MSKGKVIGYRKPINKLQNKQSGLSAVWTNGANNLYPLYVQNSIDGSPTGSRAHKMHVDYIVGELSIPDVLVNAKKEYYLSNILFSAGSDLSAQGGFYIHRNLKWEVDKFVTDDTSIIPFENARINKEDDHGFYSKIYVSDKFSSYGWHSFKEKDLDFYYRFTNKQSEIKYQIEDYAKKNGIDTTTEEGLLKAVQSFPGQIRFVNDSVEFPYPSSPVASVLPDMESEYAISHYTNEQSINGFMGKVVAFVMEDDGSTDEDASNKLEQWLGTEGSGGIFVQMMKNTDDPDKLIVIKKFESNFDDKLFEVTCKRLRQNILGAFDNLPEILIYAGDGALFGTNPETFENARKFYSSNTRKKRQFLNKVISETLGIEFELKGYGEN